MGRGRQRENEVDRIWEVKGKGYGKEE